MSDRSPKPSYVIEGLSRQHDRASFSCGDAACDAFLHRHARQSQEKDLSRTFVLRRVGESAILGYYTLTLRQVAFDAIPIAYARRLPRHPIPVVHLAWLAVAKGWQGQGLGEALVMDALRRARHMADNVGIHAVDVEAIDDSVIHWYQKKFGFVLINDARPHLFLSMQRLRRWLAGR